MAAATSSSRLNLGTAPASEHLAPHNDANIDVVLHLATHPTATDWHFSHLSRLLQAAEQPVKTRSADKQNRQFRPNAPRSKPTNLRPDDKRKQQHRDCATHGVRTSYPKPKLQPQPTSTLKITPSSDRPGHCSPEGQFPEPRAKLGEENCDLISKGIPQQAKQPHKLSLRPGTAILKHQIAKPENPALNHPKP